MAPARTEAEKARRKEAHRLSMVASGGVFVAMALAAGVVLLYKGAMPSFLLRAGSAPAPRPALPETIAPRVAFAPWGPAVVARARREGKPILLSIYAPWSYASRLMDHRAYSDPAAAALIASRFVAARADADARPDAARRYLGGGWPTTAVLLPNGQILDSATYMEPEVLARWLGALADGWEKGRERAEASAAKALEERAKAPEPRPADAAQVAERARRELSEASGGGPHFPFWRRWRLLKDVEPGLAQARLKEDLSLEDAARRGFFRASTEPEGSPGDQAEAARALAGVDDAAARRAAAGSWARPGPRPGAQAAQAAAELESGLDKRRALRRLDQAARRPATGLLDDALALIDAELSAGRAQAAAKRALAAERTFMDEKTGALYDRVAPGELPPPLDRLLDPGLNFEAWRLFRRLDDALPPGDPRRERFRARARALTPWLLARAPWLDPAERLILATSAQRRLQE